MEFDYTQSQILIFLWPCFGRENAVPIPTYKCYIIQ